MKIIKNERGDANTVMAIFLVVGMALCVLLIPILVMALSGWPSR